MLKQCAECGEEFAIDETKRNWQHVKFCSANCQRLHSNRLKREQYSPQEWPQRRLCVRCGKEFIVNGPGGSRQTYCSKECWREGREQQRLEGVERGRKSKVCPECKKAFIPSRFHQSKQIYCSKSCYFKALREKSIHANNRLANQTELAKAKRIVAKRDGKKCVLCGRSVGIQVHHLDYSGGKKNGNNHPDNLATLCGTCHKAMHRIEIVPRGAAWVVRGNIFRILGLTGLIEIDTDNSTSNPPTL